VESEDDRGNELDISLLSLLIDEDTDKLECRLVLIASL